MREQWLWLVTLVAVLLGGSPAFCQTETPEAAEESEPPPPAPTPVPLPIELPREETHFRIGFNGFATFDHCGCDGVTLKPGAALVMPHFDVIIKYGLGLRLGFIVDYHQGEEGSIGNSLAGVDVTYYTEVENPDTERTERVKGYVFSYGMSINFKYEITVPPTDPAYRFFKIVQPYFGTGVGLVWTRTHTDLPGEPPVQVLIDNEAYRGADPPDYDPWSLQFGPAFNLFGGLHFNVDEKFRLNFELGYYLVDVPGGDEEGHLRWSTEGHHAHHEAYKINDFKIGGGLEWLF